MIYKWMPVVLEDRCTGCGLCVEACGPRSLELIKGITVLVAPETCGSEEHCIAACDDQAIQMAWVAFAGETGPSAAGVSKSEPKDLLR